MDSFVDRLPDNKTFKFGLKVPGYQDLRLDDVVTLGDVTFEVWFKALSGDNEFRSQQGNKNVLFFEIADTELTADQCLATYEGVLKYISRYQQYNGLVKKYKPSKNIHAAFLEPGEKISAEELRRKPSSAIQRVSIRLQDNVELEVIAYSRARSTNTCIINI